MAEHLASIYGTEKDRVNCPFYFKIGACRHGERCSRLHMRPTLSQTILMTNMYENPEYAAATGAIPAMTKAQCQDHFEDFYEDVFEECAKFGEVEGLNVCDNMADHLVGNVYVKFRDEEHALAARNALHNRYYDKRPIKCEFSPPSRISARARAGSTRSDRVTAPGSATSCTCARRAGSCGSSCSAGTAAATGAGAEAPRAREHAGTSATVRAGGRDFERRKRSRSRSRSRDRGDGRRRPRQREAHERRAEEGDVREVERARGGRGGGGRRRGVIRHDSIARAKRDADVLRLRRWTRKETLLRLFVLPSFAIYAFDGSAPPSAPAPPTPSPPRAPLDRSLESPGKSFSAEIRISTRGCSPPASARSRRPRRRRSRRRRARSRARA